MSTYVLVHGAYHGAWCYARVVPLLEAAGHKVVAVDLPGHGDNPAPRDQITLAAYVDHVCGVLDAQDEPVILVGHSLGGISISQVAEERSEKVAKLVFLTALMPKDGETRAIAAARLGETPTVGNARVPTEDGLASTVRDEMIKPLFYGDCSDADIATAKANLVPQAMAIMGTEVHLTDARYGSVPRVFIECLQDGAIPIDMQRRMVADVPCETVMTLDTSHSPFYSAPRELADQLLSL
ncbi:MAG: alpha/beta fold hydrolase [Alphaproteobacteria bacterium]|nr:alpha/beta fold hydrolase [Alphaproteobacteria bacterium]